MRTLLRSASRVPRVAVTTAHRRRLTSAVAAASLAAGSLLALPAASAVAASPSDPLMFGASGSTRTLVESHERVLGAKLQGLRVYKSWGQPLFTSSQTWARDTGHTLFVSVKSERKGGADVKFRDIANARPGSTIYRDMQQQAQQIKAFRAKVYIAFNHEPEASGSRSLGDGDDFIAAWRKLISVWRAEGVRNAEYVWNMTAWSFRRDDSRRAEAYYPGDAYVDHIAADGYNWYRCRSNDGGWADLANVIEGHRAFGAKHPDKGLMLWEFGSTEDQARPGRKADWFNDVVALFQRPAYHQYNVLLHWEGRNHHGSGKCGFDYRSSASATKAWVNMAKNPAFSATKVD